jgi:ribosomal protein S18 acetylase RimI-like enzyme
MASSDVLVIERLALDDVAGGLALSDAAGWNQSADDWSFFIAAGAVFGVRDEAGTLVATAAALPYDDTAGWISMVLVDPAHRHRGIASQLVDACVRSLREAGRSAVLDATPAGAAVYAKIGFVAGFAFERWEGEGGETIAATTSESDIAAAPAQADTLIALDRSASGVDRALLLRSFLARPATRAWLAPRGDGFALRRAGRRAAQVGPIVAGDDAAALALLALALDDVAGRVFIDVPVDRTAIADALTRRRFVRQRPFVRMALGDARAAAARERVFALAGPEFG